MNVDRFAVAKKKITWVPHTPSSRVGILLRNQRDLSDGVVRTLEAQSYGICKNALNAGFSLIRPFLLNRVLPQRSCLPGANIANLAIGVVIPALARNRIGNRFAKFVRAGDRKCIERCKAAGAALTTGIGHHGVINIVAEGVVIAAKILAGSAAS